MAKVHIAHPENPARTWGCDLPIADPRWAGGALRIESIDFGRATCLKCCRARAEATPAEPAFARSAAQPARYGTRVESRVGRLARELARRGEAAGAPRFRTVEQAVRGYLRARVEGAAVRSSADIGIRVQTGRDPSLGGRAHHEVDRHRTIALALSRAVDELERGNGFDLRGLPGEAWLDAYVLVVVGRLTMRTARAASGAERKGTFPAWSQVLPEDAAWELTARLRPPMAPIERAAVIDALRYFGGAVRDALLASGELGSGRQSEEVEADGRRSSWDPLRRLRASRAARAD